MRVPAIKATRESIRYGFAVGKVRVLETKVFGHATYERLLDATDFREQMRILSDTVYGRYLEGAETTADVERALDSALDDFYRFLDEANLPKPVVLFFRERYDFANLKGALKARVLDTATDDLLVGLGTIPLEEFTGPLEDLPDPFGALAAKVLEEIAAEGGERVEQAGRRGDGSAAGTGDGALRIIDAEIDRAMFVELARLARASKSEFLRSLAALEIDIANVKALLRARITDTPADEALETALDGGGIPRKELAEIYSMPIAEAVERLADLPALKGATAADLADLSRLDVLADNVVVAQLRRARLASFGAEPVIAYVMGREAEVRAVRTLLVGKLAGLSVDVLRSRLRDVYV